MNLPAVRTIRRRDGHVKVKASRTCGAACDPETTQLRLEAEWQGQQVILVVLLPDRQRATLGEKFEPPFGHDPELVMARIGMAVLYGQFARKAGPPEKQRCCIDSKTLDRFLPETPEWPAPFAEDNRDSRIRRELEKIEQNVDGVCIAKVTAKDLMDQHVELFSSFWTEDEVDSVLQQMRGESAGHDT